MAGIYSFSFFVRVFISVTVIKMHLVIGFSHVASIAAGNAGVPVVVNGYFYGQASGMAPRARSAFLLSCLFVMLIVEYDSYAVSMRLGAGELSQHCVAKP